MQLIKLMITISLFVCYYYRYISSTIRVFSSVTQSISESSVWVSLEFDVNSGPINTRY